MSQRRQEMPMPGYPQEGQYSQRMPQPQDYSNYSVSPPVDEFNRLEVNEHSHHRPHHPGQESHAHHFPTETQRQTEQQHEALQHHPSNVVIGPLLRYDRIDHVAKVWRGSCLIVSDDTSPPVMSLHIGSERGASRTLHAHPDLLDVYRNEFHFWRFPLEIPLAEHDQTVVYTATCFVTRMNFTFHLPAVQDNMRFMFYSCNGFADVSKPLQKELGAPNHPLWQDVLDKHATMPFHVLIGGGDQLYSDDMIEEEFMKPWITETDIPKRMALPRSMFEEPMEAFYFNNYVNCFGPKGNPLVAEAFASIPSVNMWDDHDIIDGYGSYPNDMQNTELFQVLFANAVRFYLLLQHHTTLKRTEADGLIRGTLPTCNSVLTNLGPQVSLLCLDARGERTKYDICRPETYHRIFECLYRMVPPTTRHLIVVTGVPIIYPRLTLFESAMGGIRDFNLATLVGKTGALGDIINGQLNNWNGDPELLDDMNDHWGAAGHESERKLFIERLQKFAKHRSIRVSFIAGDVHCCAAGKLYSKDMREKEEGDPHLMMQVVSSAIVNAPPPQALLTYLGQNASPVSFNGNTEEKMFNIFKMSPNGNSRTNQKLMGRRNYCAGYFDKEGSNKLCFWIQAEIDPGEKHTAGYLLAVPQLLFGPAGLQHLAYHY
ncbi:hypothetical protein K450DRAFT_243713 [Umbelopsis ramanniana AG]|uniref:PhoD-like phosphatase domain-containing protein n=1 Tax=Umbelopsis ramanniana AG TaxID=1314678 RepID=A0AAD5EBA0_UMBRA|nr:uncharacterized protein K450DRAFT_243713 [Umbelopsis ramanniana AG]KAI8579070.1 hypothetical protein K450DRAFT_243713 [Umbelopsis ramanniana AG]